MTVKTTLNAKDVDNAYLRIKDVVKETPLQFDLYLSQKYDCNVYLKEKTYNGFALSNLEAYNAISVLTSEAKEKGITCASAGNHAQGVAYTAKALNLKAVIFMPVTTPLQKVNQVKFLVLKR